jgi:hypothetical protein
MYSLIVQNGHKKKLKKGAHSYVVTPIFIWKHQATIIKNSGLLTNKYLYI